VPRLGSSRGGWIVSGHNVVRIASGHGVAMGSPSVVEHGDPGPPQAATKVEAETTAKRRRFAVLTTGANLENSSKDCNSLELRLNCATFFELKVCIQ
jgi:hypothetical protein